MFHSVSYWGNGIVLFYSCEYFKPKVVNIQQIIRQNIP